jgi:hypothetical protein
MANLKIVHSNGTSCENHAVKRAAAMGRISTVYATGYL